MKGALPQHSFKGGEPRSRTPSPSGRRMLQIPRVIWRKSRIIIAVLFVWLLLVQLRSQHPTSSSSPLRASSLSDIAILGGLKNQRAFPYTSGLFDKEKEKKGEGLKVALLNSPRYHFEVVLPLLHVLSHQPGVTKLELFVTEEGSTRLGVRPLLHRQMPKLPKKQSWLPGGKESNERAQLVIRDPKQIKQMGWVADVMVMTSCSRDFEDIEFWSGPDEAGAPKEILCLLHESEEWKNTDSRRRKMLQPWIEKGKVSAMVLSPHVRDYVSERVEKEWNMTTILEDKRAVNVPGLRMLPSFAPVFEDPELWDWKILNANFPGPFTAIPGKYENYRRDYQKIFRHMLPKAAELRKHNSVLRIAGFGPLPTIDASIVDLLQAHSGYEFPQYFSLLAKSMAMFPAFAHHKYLEDRASSTVATAVISGVPLICTKELVERYSYLNEDTAWIQKDGEEEVDTWLRVLELGPKAITEKKNNVKLLRSNIIVENKKLVKTFLEEAKHRIDLRNGKTKQDPPR